MKHARFAAAVAACCLTAAAARAADAPVKSYAIPSWGDYTLVYGPGTDPAMGTPAEMENMFRFWKARGYNGVFLRSDLQQFEPFVVRNPKTQMNAGLALLWQYIDVQAEKSDYFESAQKAADKVGFEFWVWHPYVYSQGGPANVGVDGFGRMVPWSYESKLIHDHPEMLSIDRKGNKYWMIPEYAYPVARQYQVGEFVHMAKKYGIKRFIASFRSEVNQLIDPADKADRYGFNKPVVDDMKRLYNVDIMTDPRFDVDSPAFDTHDPMVEKWHNLRGQYLTQFFRELRAGLSAVDPKIKIAATLGGETIGPPIGNFKTDWRTWVDEGLVDMIIAPVHFQATLDPDVPKKGYITDPVGGVGVVSFATLKEYVSKSRHPDIQLLSTGGPPYFNEKPEAGADSWQRDVWYSSYHLAWSQRWAQYMRDVRELGSIKFLEQNFDKVDPKEFAGISGGWGVVAYNPKLRACPGGWWRLGTGDNARPFAQTAVRRGNKGQALQLTAAADGSGTLTGWHMSSPDRSALTGAVDTSITNGSATFDFWLRRKDAQSGVAAYLQSDGETDIGLRIAPESGSIFYATAPGKWAETGKSMPVGQWRKFSIQVDLDRLQYRAEMGEGEKDELCRAVPVAMPKERFIDRVNDAANIPLKVPAFRQFQRVFFAPEGVPGSTVYLDDVLVRWKPTLHYAPRGAKVEFAENFENRATNLAYGSGGPEKAGGLTTISTHPRNYVTNEMSFGQGVRGLYVSAGSRVNPAPRTRLKLNAPLTLDFDVFIGSDSYYPFLIPNPATTSAHRATIGLVNAAGKPLAAVMAGAGTWQLWNGAGWTDSGAGIHYDCWNHVQLALDGKGGYKVVVQPEGQVPSPVGQGILGTATKTDTADLAIETSGEHFSTYDNIVVTSGKPARSN